MPGFWCFTFDFVTPAPVNRKSPAVKKKTLLKKISKASSEKENIKLGSEGMAKIQDSTLVSSSPEPTGHAAMEHLTNVPSLPKLQGQQDPDSMARARTAAPDLNNQIYSDMLAGAHLGPGIICISKSDTIKLMGERATELDFTSRPHIERTILSDRPTTSVIEANKANLKWLKWSAMQVSFLLFPLCISMLASLYQRDHRQSLTIRPVSKAGLAVTWMFREGLISYFQRT